MILPTFLICGAPKAGTTALYHHFAAHPDVLMSRVKETDFFQHNYSKGLSWYASHFKHWSGERAIGEASPGNLIHNEAPERIARDLPDVKLIFILRNPIERAHSQYWYGIQRGVEDPSITFSELIRDSHSLWGRRVLDLGLYYEQLLRYDKRFGPDQIKIVLYDEFRHDTSTVMNDLFEFVGVAPFRDSAQRRVNETVYPRNPQLYAALYRIWSPLKNRLGSERLEKMAVVRSGIRNLFFRRGKNRRTEISDEDRRLLQSYYSESNEKLAAYLGRDLSHWK